jgi:hypothetical protein
MENQYGIGIANRYDVFFGQDDVTDFETVITKKKKEKAKEATAAPVVGAPKSAEKENKVQPKPQQQQQALKAQPQKDQKRGIKEQNNTGIGKKDGESGGSGALVCGSRLPLAAEFSAKFGGFRAQIWIFLKFSQKMCFSVRPQREKRCDCVGAM